MPAEPLALVLRGDDADCAITAIACYTGRTYADVMREVVKHDVTGGTDGLTNRVIRRTLRALGEDVRFTKHVDLDEHYGILLVTNGKKAHAVVLKHGQVIESANTWIGVWDAERYLAAGGYTVEGIFVSKD